MPDAPPALDDFLGFHIRRAHGAVYWHFNETFGAIGLTRKQTSVLWLIRDTPAISQADIARRLQIDRATMMAITNSLAKRGLLERLASAADRRRQTLNLTLSGKQALERALNGVLTQASDVVNCQSAFWHGCLLRSTSQARQDSKFGLSRLQRRIGLSRQFAHDRIQVGLSLEADPRQVR